MKKVVTSLLILSGIAFAQNSVDFSVVGMTCGGCAAGLNESFLEDLPQYKSHVDYETAILHVSSKDGSDVNVEEVKKTLDEMGFKGRVINIKK